MSRAVSSGHERSRARQVRPGEPGVPPRKITAFQAGGPSRRSGPTPFTFVRLSSTLAPPGLTTLQTRVDGAGWSRRLYGQLIRHADFRARLAEIRATCR